jgi:hypothetical protein
MPQSLSRPVTSNAEVGVAVYSRRHQLHRFALGRPGLDRGTYDSHGESTDLGYKIVGTTYVLLIATMDH